MESKKVPNSWAGGGARQLQEFMELHSGAPAPSACLWSLVHSFLLHFSIPPPQQMTFSTGLLVLPSLNIGFFVALSCHTSNSNFIAHCPTLTIHFLFFIYILKRKSLIGSALVT